ncbi:MAG: hypothetical protein U0R78_17690 [Nocardioidaceae bacterium]
MAKRSKKTLLEQSLDTAKAAVPVVESVVESIVDAAKEGLDTAKGIANTTETKLADALPEPVVDRLPVLEKPAHKGRGRLTKLLFLGALAAVGAAVFKKLRSGSSSDNWQSSYVPAPAPTPAPATDDAGSGPDEAVSDATAEPHEPTTPDSPAEVVDVEDTADKA